MNILQSPTWVWVATMNRVFHDADWLIWTVSSVPFAGQPAHLRTPTRTGAVLPLLHGRSRRRK